MYQKFKYICSDLKSAHVNMLELFLLSISWRQMCSVNRMAWGPMGQGKNEFFNNFVLINIGEKYGKTASQVGLRFLVQQGIPVIPKSVSIERMKENMDIFDFVLDDCDMAAIRALNIHDKVTRDFNDPAYAQKIVSQVF